MDILCGLLCMLIMGALPAGLIIGLFLKDATALDK